MGPVELKLTASRPQAFRYVRLAKVLEAVEKAVERSPGETRWVGALRQLDDSKGDLTATWLNAAAREEFSALVDQAWRDLGEDGDDVAHEVLD